MPNFTPTEPDLEEMPELPEAAAPVIEAAPAQAVVPYAGQLAVLNPLLEEIDTYRRECGMDPAKHIFPDSKPATIRERFHDYKQRGTRLRNDVIAVAKKTREDALRFQKDVIAAEKTLVRKVEEIESVWASEVEKIDGAIAKEKSDKQRTENTLVAKRVEALRAIGIPINAMGIYEADGTTISDSCPLVDPWQGERLSKMAENVFKAHYTIAKGEWEKAESERTAKEAELLRLQLDERLRTRTAELQGAEVTVLPPGLREMEEVDYQRGLSEARSAISDRLAERKRDQDAREADLQRQRDDLARQQRAAKDSLRAARQAELKAVNGFVPADDATDMDLDLAEVSAEDWEEHMGIQRAAFEAKKEKERLDSERAAIWAKTPGHELMDSMIEGVWHEMSAEEFQSWVNMAGASERERLETEAKAEQKRLDDLAAAERDRLDRLESLRPDKEKISQYARDIQAVPVPELATDEGRKALDILRKGLEATLAALV